MRGAVLCVAPLLCEVARRCGHVDIASDLTEIGEVHAGPVFERASSLVADAASNPLTRLLAISSYAFLASTVRVLANETFFCYLLINLIVIPRPVLARRRCRRCSCLSPDDCTRSYRVGRANNRASRQCAGTRRDEFDRD